jgi:hypothetical protein
MNECCNAKDARQYQATPFQQQTSRSRPHRKTFRVAGQLYVAPRSAERDKDEAARAAMALVAGGLR